MLNVIEEAKEDFNLFHNDYQKYKEKVEGISNLFKLKNKAKLRSDFLPTYLVGNFLENKEKYVLFGINPGFSEKQNIVEEGWKNKSWDNYENFVKEFFILFKNNKSRSPYYIKLSKLFCGLENISLNNNEEIYNYYSKHLINIKLIPYHSTSFGISPKLTEEQREYFKQRLQKNIDFLKNIKVKLLIFN